MSTTPVVAKPTEELLDGKKIHPLAALFPPMSPDEFAAIAEDIKAHGLVEPIVLLEGQILDGTHRLKACLQEGKELKYKDWAGEGGTPLQYVWSRNWTRRHLNAGQRAVIALTAEKQFAEVAAVRLSPHARAQEPVERIPQVSETGKARDAAGQLAGVNAHYVQDAKFLSKSNPSLLEEVRLGHKTLPSALRQAKAQAIKPGKATPTDRVKLEFMEHALISEKLQKAEAQKLFDGLNERLADGEGISVSLVEKVKKAAQKKPVSGTGEWAGKNVNIQKGCANDCRYCYAKAGAVRRKQSTPGSWTHTAFNAHIIKKGWRKYDKVIMFPSTHDIDDTNIDQCIGVLSKILGAGTKVLIVSKPHLECVKRLCAELAAYRDQILFRFTMGSANNATLKFWEPGAPAFEERLAALKWAHKAGFQTSVSCEPMLDLHIDRVVRAAKPYVTDAIWLGRVNNLNTGVAINCPKDAATKQAAVALLAGQTDDYLLGLHQRYKADPQIRYKDSIKEVVGLDRPTAKGLDV